MIFMNVKVFAIPLVETRIAIQFIGTWSTNPNSSLARKNRYYATCSDSQSILLRETPRSRGIRSMSRTCACDLFHTSLSDRCRPSAKLQTPKLRYVDTDKVSSLRLPSDNMVTRRIFRNKVSKVYFVFATSSSYSTYNIRDDANRKGRQRQLPRSIWEIRPQDFTEVR